jgi:hypothetical protein
MHAQSAYTHPKESEDDKEVDESDTARHLAASADRSQAKLAHARGEPIITKSKGAPQNKIYTNGACGRRTNLQP